MEGLQRKTDKLKKGPLIMNIKYLTELPEKATKRSYTDLQAQLAEFANTDYPVMEIPIEGHYKNMYVARQSLQIGIARSGYAMKVMHSNDGKYLYVYKVAN